MKLLEELNKVLSADERFTGEDNQIIKTKVSDAARSNDEKLLKALLKNKLLKESFFTEIDEIYVFDKNQFVWVLESKEFLPDSYTMYKRTIGLVDASYSAISGKQDVSLVWPYKDCVLEGGQTKEDQKRNEIFYNETLAPDQVNRLLAPKVLGNAKRYSKDGVEEEIEFNEDDNLIIKGNNLLALNSLVQRYENKVKMIYIDPPYFFDKKKEADTFDYNSRFKLPTWLTFIKNRLVIAKKLLTDQGVIFVSISDAGQAYLKILMAEVFESQNFVETFIWRNSDNPDVLGGKSRQGVEYIHAFEINKENSYKWKGDFSANEDAPLFNTSNGIQTRIFPEQSIKFSIPDGIYPPGEYKSSTLNTELVIKDGKNQNAISITGRYKWSQDFINEEIKKGTYFLIKSKKFSIRYQRAEATTMPPEKLLESQYLSKKLGVGTNEDSNSHMKSLGLKFGFSKPESLIAYLMRAVTEESDLVLDFYMGFRVIIVIEANSYVNIRSSRLLPKFKTQKINSWCAA